MSGEDFDKIGYLQMVDIFQDLSEAEIEEIDRATTMTRTRRGRILYMPEDTSEVLFLLKEGQIQLYRISPDGKKLVIATLGPGAIFGEMTLIGQGMHNTFAEAIEDSVICVMSRDDVEHLLVTKPKVALRIFEVLGQRLREAESRLEEIAFKGIPARLASLLLQLSEQEGDDTIIRPDPPGPGGADRHLPRDDDADAQHIQGRGPDRHRPQADHDPGSRGAATDRQLLTLSPPFNGKSPGIGRGILCATQVRCQERSRTAGDPNHAGAGVRANDGAEIAHHGGGTTQPVGDLLGQGFRLRRHQGVSHREPGLGRLIP